MGSQAKNQLVMDFMILIDTKDVLQGLEGFICTDTQEATKARAV